MKTAMVLVFTILSKVCVSQEAKFSYQFHSNEIKAGNFSFFDPFDSLSFEVTASAGYLEGANNPYLQSTKSIGPIPNGTWEIYAIKSEQKFTLRLRPTSDVTVTNRDGFLIHGVGPESTPEKSSLGCIIISDREARKKLVKAFKKYGVIKVSVSNMATSKGIRS